MILFSPQRYNAPVFPQSLFVNNRGFFVPLQPMNAHLNNPVFEAIANVSEETGIAAWVIGGFVRDIFLQRDHKQDIDVVVLGSGIDFAHAVAQKLGNEIEVKFFRNFGTAMFPFKGWKVEFVGARKESYNRDSRKPVVEDGTLEDDQNRRDFTINAMALSLQWKDFGTLIDPFNGLEDLDRKVIRTPLDPDITFSDDPLRMMRAIRFACQLDFDILPSCFESIRKNAERIDIVSPERIMDEINLMVLSPSPSKGFLLMDEAGLLNRILPEMVALKGAEIIDGKGHKDNFLHTLAVLDNVARDSGDLWLRWAAVLHDIAKPVTKKYVDGIGWTFHAHDFKGAKMIPRIFRRLRLPMNEKMRYVQKLVQLHLRPIALAQEEVTDSAVRRLLFEAGDDIDDLMILCKADITSKNPQKVKRFRHNFDLVGEKLIEIEEKDRLRNWQPPISGDLIMKTFGIPPSKNVGIIKDAITEAILEGEIPNEYEAAYTFMIDQGNKLGLDPVK